MWSGTIADIPNGWSLCDGNNGTPDLSSKFIVGYDSINQTSYNIGSTGGNSTITLTTSEIPSHSHEITITDSGHNHQTFASGEPNNQIGFSTQGQAGGQYSRSGTNGNNKDNTAFINQYVTSSNQTGISATAGNTGSDGSHENIPPYYALAFIKRTS